MARLVLNSWPQVIHPSWPPKVLKTASDQFLFSYFWNFWVKMRSSWCLGCVPQPGPSSNSALAPLKVLTDMKLTVPLIFFFKLFKTILLKLRQKMPAFKFHRVRHHHYLCPIAIYQLKGSGKTHIELSFYKNAFQTLEVNLPATLFTTTFVSSNIIWKHKGVKKSLGDEFFSLTGPMAPPPQGASALASSLCGAWLASII